MATPQNSGAQTPPHALNLHSAIATDTQAAHPCAFSPLTGFAHSVFSGYTWNDNGAYVVPCVRFEDGEVLSFWHTPDFSLHDDPTEAASDFGHRAAAAVVIFTQRFGSDAGVTLQDVICDPAFVAAMADTQSSNERHAARTFMYQIGRYLWALGQHFSPAQIVADAESAIAESHQLSAADAVMMASC